MGHQNSKGIQWNPMEFNGIPVPQGAGGARGGRLIFSWGKLAFSWILLLARIKMPFQVGKRDAPRAPSRASRARKKPMMAQGIKREAKEAQGMHKAAQGILHLAWEFASGLKSGL